MGVSSLSNVALLQLIPQQTPFRFIEAITKVDEQAIEGIVRFDKELDFYRGHFPGRPVTPGVILLEAMCQVGVVAHGIYLFSLSEPTEDPRNWTTLFSDADKVEFISQVQPGESLHVRSEAVFWRRRKLRSKIEMRKKDGTLVASAIVSGVGVRNVQ